MTSLRGAAASVVLLQLSFQAWNVAAAHSSIHAEATGSTWGTPSRVAAQAQAQERELFAEERAVLEETMRPGRFLLTAERSSRANRQQDFVIPELFKAEAPHVTGKAFRNKACTDVAAREELGVDMEVIDLLSVAPAAKEGEFEPKVACLVYGYQGGRQELVDAYATWGQDCDSFLAFSDEAYADEAHGFKTIEVHPRTGIERDLIGKLNASFHEVGRRVDAGELDFDFLAVSGDDTFWITPNLRKMLRTGDVYKQFRSGSGVLLGRKFIPPGDSSFPSGAGYVIDKVALRAYLEGHCQAPAQGAWWEDVYLADCLRHSSKQIEVYEPRDEYNRMIFHPFSPQLMAQISYTNSAWFAKYSEAMQPIVEGIRGISPDSVLFHYVEGRLRCKIHDRLYAGLSCPALSTGKQPVVSAAFLARVGTSVQKE